MKDKLLDVNRSFKEAFDVIEVSQAIFPSSISPFYDEIGVYKLLKDISDNKILDSFIEYHIGTVIEHDKANNTDLLNTLDTYLECMGAKQETANQLFIHRQTLYSRLEKLHDLLGDDFLQTENRICLEIALRMNDLVSIPVES
jgi:purine catabolism regulator